MKTKHIKIRNRTARKLPRILAAYIAAFLGLGGLAQGQDQFWDGSNTQPNNMVDGGSGTWDSTTTNWTTASGGTNSSWLNGMAVFGGLTPGIVTVTQPIFFAGLEFMTSGYQIDQGIAGSLNLIGSPTITTDPGVTATINATLAGAGGITKEGLGTLVLSGANTYFGSTAINAGTLSISSDANLGTPPSTVVPDQLTFDNGATLQATASFTVNPNRGITLLAGGGTIDVTGTNTLSYAGSISGTGNLGNLTKVGTGTLILRGPNSYMGTTFVNDGTLTLVSSGASTLHHIIIGPLIIGDDVGAPNTATVMDGIILGLQPKIANSIPVTVNSDGLFVVNVGIPSLGQGEAVGQLVINRGNVRVEGSLLPGFQDPVGQHLEMNGGSISGAGTIGFLPDVTATSDASGNAATISANAKLPDASRVLTVNDGPGSTDLLISGVIFQETVPVGITKEGAGTLVLSGANTYTGLTTVTAGTLAEGVSNAIFTGDLTINGATAIFDLGANHSDSVGIVTLDGGGSITGTGTSTLTSTGSFEMKSGTASAILDGSVALNKTTAGTVTLNGVNTYTGLTTVTAGTLAEGVSNAISTGDLTINGATAIFDLGANHSDSVGIVTLDGGGSITGTGTSTLTSTGSFEMKSGTASAILDGSVALNKTTTGTVTLTGANTYTGATMVDAGTLLVDGSLAAASAVTVNSGATLGGTGTAAGAVTIANGGILAPGNSPGTLTVGSLSLSNASLLNYELGTPGAIGSGVNDLTIVNGNLTLDGVLNTTPLVGFGPGAYRLFSYGGALTDNTLDIGTVPPGFSASNFTVITGLPNEVDVLVLAGPPPPSVQFWDGPNTVSNGVIDGGTGEWDNFTTNWTDASGNNNSSWLNGVAVFAGTAGTVTVTQPIFFAGLEFMTSGYQIDQGIAGSLNLIGSPTITTDPGVTATINATLAGAGGITKEGLGTLVLSGANTYLGITAINAGVLSISSDANLGTAPGAPVADQLTFDGGTLQATASFDLAANRSITLLGGSGTIGVTAANILSYGGVITGGGSLTKADTGTLQLFGINTYTGATTVNGGTLAAGAINTLPSQTALTVATGAIIHLNNFSQSIGSLAGTGSVTLGTATLTTGNNNTSTDFSGVVSGLGGLTKVGTGTQTLSGDNTYSGGTTISTGTLQLGNGGTSGSIVGDVVNNATFAVNRSDTFTFGGVISGTGAFQQNGPGTVVFTAANTSTGTTVVNDGSLFVDKSISSAQTLVNAGGLLGGHGTLGGSLTNGGIVSPGTSPGTLTVNGNYTQNANGTLRIEVAGTAPGQFDLLAVGGHASLAGTLQLVSLGNFQLQVGDKATFLTAQGGVSGTFSTIQSPFVLIKAQIIYLPNAVQLEGTQGSFTAVACNPNTLAVANALDSAVGDPRASGLIEFLDTQPLSELCGDLELIAPDELPAMFNIGVSLANIQTVNLERRMEDIRAGSSGFSAKGFSIDSRVPDFSPGLAGPTGPEGKSGPSVMQPTPENRWGVFVTGLGEFTDVDSTSIVPGYNFSTGGLTFGADYRLSPNFAIGLTGGYAHTNADLVNNGSLDVNGGTIGAYATGFAGGFYVNAAAFGVFNGYDSHRTALLGTASGNTDGQDFNALAMAGYDWKRGDLTVGPLASFQYTYVGLDSFTEHGSLAPLSFSNQNAESTRTALGAKASYEWHVGHVVVKPEIRASWQHEFGDTEYSIVSRFASGAGNSFTVNGSAIGRDSLLIGAGAAVLLNDRVSVYAYYDGELARTNYSSNNVSAGVRFTF